MAQYLLPCKCGKQVTVDPGQAGGQVTCECGARLEVPPLRAMRDLCPATEGGRSSGASGAGSRWTGWQAIAAAGFILAAVLAGGAAYVWMSRTPVPIVVPEERNPRVAEEIEAWPPAVAWQNWEQYYRPLRHQGFVEQKDEQTLALEAAEQLRARVRNILLIFAAIVLAASCAVLVVRK